MADRDAGKRPTSADDANPASELSPGNTVTGRRPSQVSDGGHRLGNYRLLEKIGEGGMGEVYAAEQVSPIRRKVALKIVKLGMDTREFTARFESERQALALMDHPYIARVYDAGATERGRPYFVMEYVDGVPLLKHCNDHRCNLKQRIELFIKICEGIQHAHQKAIIHRDIKPSNVLVTVQEETVWPKIIDFGVAKAVGQKLSEETVQTGLGELIGSPGYLSPEQAELASEKIDTRTDIYLLGVLLYELLTGALPFDRARWRDRGLHELLRLTREVDPPRPSLRVAELGEQQEMVALERQTTPSRLVVQLRGELDWIIMKTLEKDRARRYETASALIQDLRRFLDNEPVLAGPPSRRYRLTKFAHRNRVAVIAATFVLTAVLLGTVGTAIGMIRAQRSERAAKAEARAVREVADFMVGLFSVTDPGEARGQTITAREILDRGVDRIQGDLEAQPLTRARLMNTMGRVYRELGLYEPAHPLLAESLQLLQVESDASVLDVATAENDLGTLLWRQGEYEMSRHHLERSLALRLQALGSDHPDVAQSLNSLGNLYWLLGDFARADSVYREALGIREQVLEPNDPSLAITLNNLGGLSMRMGDYRSSRAYLERALVIRENAYGEDHPDVASSLASLGSLSYTTGDHRRAREYYERALVIREMVLGADHPLIATTLNDLASPLADMGEHDAARACYQRAAAIQESALGADHPSLANTLSNYAAFLRSQGAIRQAHELFERSFAILRKSAGDDHIRLATCLNNLAVTLMDLGDFAGAEEHLTNALSIQNDAWGDDHPDVALTLKNLGDVSYNRGDYEHAREHYARCEQILTRIHGPDHRDVALGLGGLGRTLTELGDYVAAEAALTRAAAIREAAVGPDHVDVAASLSDLAIVYYHTGEIGRAHRLFRRALDIQEDKLPIDHPHRVVNCYNLACLTSLQGDREAALAYLRQAIAGGFAHPYIDQDPDLSLLRGDPEFEALVRQASGR
jgi:eukaryotic-like serine/threonine-protein kinase